MDSICRKTVIISGVSLVEVMVVLVISGVLFGTISVGFPNLNRSINKMIALGAFKEPYLIFLMIFEAEYRLAESSSHDDLANLIFKHDENLDGDCSDSGESIRYRWNTDKIRIDRKSGNGYFQALLDGVEGFTWQVVSNDPLCHEMILVDTFSTTPRKMKFCR